MITYFNNFIWLIAVELILLFNLLENCILKQKQNSQIEHRAVKKLPPAIFTFKMPYMDLKFSKLQIFVERYAHNFASGVLISK